MLWSKGSELRNFIHAHLQDITASLPNISLSCTFTPASTTEIRIAYIFKGSQ